VGWSWTTGGGSVEHRKITLIGRRPGPRRLGLQHCLHGGSKSFDLSGTGGGGGGGTVAGLSPNFTYALPVKAGVATTFDASSSTGGPTTFYWTFGDGSAAIFGNPYRIPSPPPAPSPLRW
jgi:hypothetical protein